MSKAGPVAMLQGTLALMILAVVDALERGGDDNTAYGYAVAREIERRSLGTLRVEEGSLYPALRRLVAGKAVRAAWRDTPTGRRGRCYSLTAHGRKRLDDERRLWASFSAAVERVAGGGSAVRGSGASAEPELPA